MVNRTEIVERAKQKHGVMQGVGTGCSLSRTAGEERKALAESRIQAFNIGGVNQQATVGDGQLLGDECRRTAYDMPSHLQNLVPHLAGMLDDDRNPQRRPDLQVT